MLGGKVRRLLRVGILRGARWGSGMQLGGETFGPMTLGRDRRPPRDFRTLQNLPDPVVAQEARLGGQLNWNMHRHDRGQMIFVVSERADVDTRAQHWTLGRGQAIWLPGGIEHSVSSPLPPHFRSLYVRPDLARRLGDRPVLLRVSPFLTELGRRLTGLFNGEGAPESYPHLVALLLAEVGGTSPAPELPMPQDRRLQRICDVLDRDPADRRTLAEWAVTIGASCRTLERLFRVETGMGFAEWRQICRIRAALPLLAERVPVQRVAWQVGYDSPSAFAAAFRKVTGVSPTGFRPDM